MTHTSAQIERWVAELLHEAKRDLIFLWHICDGAFGGEEIAPDDETLETVLTRLVDAGCYVGYGDPSFPNWRVPEELKVSREQLAGEIVRLRLLLPEHGKFITFAIREKAELHREG